MSRPAPKIRLTTKEKEILLRWMRSSKTEQRMVERARVILLASNGLSGKEIALEMGTRQARVSKWLRRFALDRIAGLTIARARQKNVANTLRLPKSVSCKRSMSRRLRAIAAGTGDCFLSSWAMSASTRSGG